MNNRRFLVAIAAVVGILSAAGICAGAEPRSYELGNAVIAPFAQGGSRTELLAGCKAALAEGRAGSYEAEFRSLVEALAYEPGPPRGYDKAPAQRSEEEVIRAAIYDFNGDRSYKLDDVLPRDVILAAGTAALGPLMETLDDATPTRVIGQEEGLSLTILLRREDIALRYIEKISGVPLFQRTQGRGGQFHNDPQRAAFLAKIRAWWETAKGKSQADIRRMEIALRGANESEVLYLAELEGPESVREQVLKLMGPETFCDGPLALGVREFDSPAILRPALERFRNHKAYTVDYNLLARWGDQAVYRELAAQAAADPTPWGGTDLSEDVAQYGQNWGIPLLAAMLTQTKGQEYGPSRLLSAADFALNHFQKLVGKDFGYDFRGPQAERFAAIRKARAWWESEGKTAMAGKINEPHEYAATDVFEAEEQITARAAATAVDNDEAARAAVAALPKSYAVKVQRALLARLGREKEATYRLAILGKIGDGATWEAPALAECFESDADTAVRAAAGKLLLTLEARPGLGTYETMLAAVRRVADDTNASQEWLQIAAQLLLKADSSLDDARLRRLRGHLPTDAALDRHFEHLEQRRHPEYAVP
jgi:hypothetical protein